MVGTWAKKDPYRAARTQIEGEYRRVKDRTDWLKRLEDRRNDNGASALRFVIGSYLYFTDNPDHSLEKAASLCPVLASNTSYEVVRARFLITCRFDYGTRLMNLGQRLLDWKEDFDVRYEWCAMMSMMADHNRKGYELALKATRELVSKYPKRGKVYSVLGMVYWQGYTDLAIQADGQKAISSFKKYLSFGPPNCRAKRWVIGKIQSFESETKGSG